MIRNRGNDVEECGVSTALMIADFLGHRPTNYEPDFQRAAQISIFRDIHFKEELYELQYVVWRYGIVQFCSKHTWFNCDKYI